MENEGGIHAGGRKSEAQSQLQEALDLGGKKGPSDPWPKDNMMQSEVLEKRSRKASWRRYWLDPPRRAGLELGWVDAGRGGIPGRNTVWATVWMWDDTWRALGAVWELT